MQPILDQFGQPIQPQAAEKPPLTDEQGQSIYGHDGMLLPHYRTFSTIYNAFARTYRYTHDEALRQNNDDPLAMRRDVTIQEMLRERQLPTAQANWHLEPEDPKDVAQMAVATDLQKIIERTPRMKIVLLNLLEASWYGRYAVQTSMRWMQRNGRRVLEVGDHRPVNGDKLHFDYETGDVGVRINAGEAGQYPQDAVRYTDKGAVLMLTRPQWRQKFLVHRFLQDDSDFFEPEMAGAVQGVGIRSQIYWAWWVRNEIISWSMDYLERIGAGGLTVFYYDASNDASKTQAEKAAVTYDRNTAMAWPKYNGGKETGSSIERIEPGSANNDVLIRWVSYLDDAIRRYIVGQTLSSQAESTGLGSSVADLHADTKFRLIMFDAGLLQETLTTDLVSVLQRWNYPQATFQIKWKFDLDKPDPDKQLDAVKTAHEMGVEFKKDEVRALTGMGKPQEGDETTEKAAPPSPFGGPGMPGEEQPEKPGEKKPKDDKPMPYARRGQPLRYSAGPHSYATTQLDLPEGAAKKLKEFAASIPKDELGDDGVETDPHITVKYGLHDSDPAKVREILKDYGPVTVTLGNTSLFTADGHEVLKVDVFGADLFAINRLITRSVANTENYPSYRPHATIAYLKKGAGKKYAGDKKFDGMTITFDALTFFPADGDPVKIPLDGPLSFARPGNPARYAFDESEHPRDEGGKFSLKPGEAAKAYRDEAKGHHKEFHAKLSELHKEAIGSEDHEGLTARGQALAAEHREKHWESLHKHAKAVLEHAKQTHGEEAVEQHGDNFGFAQVLEEIVEVYGSKLKDLAETAGELSANLNRWNDDEEDAEAIADYKEANAEAIADARSQVREDLADIRSSIRDAADQLKDAAEQFLSEIEYGVKADAEEAAAEAEEEPEQHARKGQPARYAAPAVELPAADELITDLRDVIEASGGDPEKADWEKLAGQVYALATPAIRLEKVERDVQLMADMLDDPKRYQYDPNEPRNPQGEWTVEGRSNNGNNDVEEEDELDLDDHLENFGFSDRDVSRIARLDRTETIKKLSSQPKKIEPMEISKITGLEKTSGSAISDPSSVPPVIVGYDGEIIDGHHRLNGLKKGGVKSANVIVATEEDLQAAKEFGGLTGRGSQSEEDWIRWMLARADQSKAA